MALCRGGAAAREYHCPPRCSRQRPRARRGSKRRAKTDWADARHLRQLVADGRIPESWIPPAHVLETRAAVRLYKDLLEERTSWQQRVHATLFHQGIPVVPKLSRQGRGQS